MHQWQQLFAAVLDEHPVVGVRAVTEWHLGRPATRSEREAARHAVRAMERAGRVKLQHVSVPRQADQLGGRLLVAGRGDLRLLEWPNQNGAAALQLEVTRQTSRRPGRPYSGCSPPSTKPRCGWTVSRSVLRNPRSRARWPTPWASHWPDSAEAAASSSGAPDDQVGEGRRRLRTRRPRHNMLPMRPTDQIGRRGRPCARVLSRVMVDSRVPGDA